MTAHEETLNVAVGSFVVKRGIGIVDKRGKVVAVVCGEGTTAEQDEQRARLFAAAPEMFEALQQARSYILRNGFGYDQQIRIDQINAVINKAIK
jgi:hypothetical protein